MEDSPPPGVSASALMLRPAARGSALVAAEDAFHHAKGRADLVLADHERRGEPQRRVPRPNGEQAGVKEGLHQRAPLRRGGPALIIDHIHPDHEPQPPRVL